jgi:hypothetical protein
MVGRITATAMALIIALVNPIPTEARGGGGQSSFGHSSSCGR